MAKAKTKAKTTNGKAKPAAKAPAKSGKAASSSPRTGDRLANARKIGERQETITRLLSPMEIEREREEVCKLLRQIDKAKNDAKNVASTHKAAIADLETRLKSHTNAANTAKRDEEITIEEWLNDRNEVIRVRTDTREIIGNRVARAAELQEDLPLDKGKPDDDAEEGDDEEEDQDDAEEGDGDDAGDDDPNLGDETTGAGDFGAPSMPSELGGGE